MNFLRWLFGSKPKPKTEPTRGFIKGPGTFDVDVVGESFYQNNLERICGRRSRKGENKLVTATLICDDNNPKDNQAVRIDIDGLTVGHLSRQEAREYRSELLKLKLGKPIAQCKAKIVGGWKRDDDIGHYGVKLDIPHD